MPDRLPASPDVILVGAGKSADDGIPGIPGNSPDRLEIAIGCDREPGLDDVDTHVVKKGSDLDLFVPESWLRPEIARRRAGSCRRSGRGPVEMICLT